MDEQNWLAERFEGHRTHLRSVAYRMLGSLSEADDAVQEAWLRLDRADAGSIENLRAWLTTVIGRVCLDMLRARTARREDAHDGHVPEPVVGREEAIEQETLLADSVGLALLVVLEALAPAERVAFVLHDLFDMSFDEIAPIVGRNATAARQLASRARRRVQGTAAVSDADLAQQRSVVDAFLAAARGGDLGALLAVLDPDVVMRGDRAPLPEGATEVRGAAAIAGRTVKQRARAARPVLVDGAVGVVIAPRGRLLMVLRFTIARGVIAEIEAVADPERLRQLELAVVGD